MSGQKLTSSSVLLVRHAQPVIVPDRPAGEWRLADQADPGVLRLVESVRVLGLDGVVASPEPKAYGTGEIMARELGLPLGLDEALREQGRDTIPWISGEGASRKAVANHFARPKDAVFGAESSAEAVDRFAGAVERARSAHGFPALVTHGRIMCGYIGRVVDQDAMSFWADLQMPDVFVLDLEAGTCVRVETIT